MVSGFGLAVIDFLIVLDGPIVVNYKNDAHGQLIQVGGVVPTALMTLTTLGMKTEFFGAVGSDYFGNEVVRILHAHKVKVDALQQVQGAATPVSVIAVTHHNGERTGFNTAGVFPHVKIDTFSPTFSPDTRVVLLDGHNPACSQEFLQKAKQQGIMTVFDFGNPKPGMESLMEEADICIVPKAYWGNIWPGKSPEEIARFLLKKEGQTVVVTMEAEGCVVGTKQEVFYQPSIEIVAVDGNGAGDIFLGAFVFGLLHKWDLRKTTAFACKVGAMSCTAVGKENKLSLLRDKLKFLHVRE